MTDVPGQNTPPAIDTTRPHSARVWNYLLGGQDNYEIDRLVAEQAKQVFPGIVDIARADRAFLGRAVRYLAGEAGVRQFLDIGSGLPTMDNTHEVAQRVAPDSRVVYVDNDPLVLVHARELLSGTAEGSTAYIEADLRDPDAIVKKASETLDFGRPVAVMLLGILHFVPDLDQAHRLVARLLDAVPEGSHLVLTHAGSDLVDLEANAQAHSEWNARADDQIISRPRADVLRFFDGLRLVEPGLVSMSRWRAPGEPAEVAGYGGVGRK